MNAYVKRHCIYNLIYTNCQTAHIRRYIHIYKKLRKAHEIKRSDRIRKVMLENIVEINFKSNTKRLNQKCNARVIILVTRKNRIWN